MATGWVGVSIGGEGITIQNVLVAFPADVTLSILTGFNLCGRDDTFILPSRGTSFTLHSSDVQILEARDDTFILGERPTVWRLPER